MTAATTSFRFIPRYRGLGLSAVGLGGALLVVGGIATAVAPILAGVVGIGMGAAYLLSPAWKLEVVVDDAGFEVRSPDKSRFRLAWADVVKVVAAPNATCFVDGGAPERSLLVPGVGAVAPYDIRDKVKLYEAILAHVPASRIERVESLEAALEAAAPAPPSSGPGG